MTGKERIQKTLNHIEADRVPYDLGGTNVTAITCNAYRNAMRYRGLSEAYDTRLLDPIQQIVTPIEENLQRLNVDTRRLGARRIPEYETRRWEEEGRIVVKDFYGCNWAFKPGEDLYFNQITYPLRDAETLSEAIDSFERIDWEDYVAILRNDLDDQVRFVGDYAGVVDRHVAGFTESSQRIRGYENWFMDTALDPEGVDRLYHIILEDKMRYWTAVAEWATASGQMSLIDVIVECDDLGAQSHTILSPATLRATVIPLFRQLFAHIKRLFPHCKVFMHSCGAIRELIPDLIDAGLDILNPVQYTAAGMALEGLKRDFGRDLTFWGGGVDTQSILNKGTAQDVSDTVKRVLDLMAPGGGFVFSPVHNVQDDVSPENFWAMWETLQEYGKY